MLLAAKQSINIIVVGGSGAIGSAICKHILAQKNLKHLYWTSSNANTPVSFDDKRASRHIVDIRKEDSIIRFFNTLKDHSIDGVIVATGILHDQGHRLSPEKSIKQLNTNAFNQVMAINCLGPLLIAKHLLPLLPKHSQGVFAAMSARVGSISDNRLGGWYSYRSSKAALNMMLKTLAIEIKRTHPQLLVCGLHPGTVDSGLSKPFQQHIPEGKLFTPEFSVQQLIKVLGNLGTSDAGKIFAWDGKEISP
jgi:NAD(P)-dependent dehydrogenase (short-subunit alcohol dehydrogenase family)